MTLLCEASSTGFFTLLDTGSPREEWADRLQWAAEIPEILAEILAALAAAYLSPTPGFVFVRLHEDGKQTQVRWMERAQLNGRAAAPFMAQLDASLKEAGSMQATMLVMSPASSMPRGSTSLHWLHVKHMVESKGDA